MRSLFVILALVLLIALFVYLTKRKKEKFMEDKIKNILKGKFKVENEKEIAKLNPVVKADFVHFINDIESLGYAVKITDGFRTIAESVALKKQNPNNASPGFSSHNYGTALDMVLYKDGVMIGKGDAYYKKWVESGVPKLAVNKYKMRWGGDFPGYKDTVHFDYQNLYSTTKLHDYVIKKYGSLDKAPLNELDIKNIV